MSTVLVSRMYIDSIKNPVSSIPLIDTRIENASRHRLGIIGAGNSACALSAYLAHAGHAVTLLARDVSKVRSLFEDGLVRASGKISGTFELTGVTTSYENLLEQTDTIFVATLATVYSDVARALAPYLSGRHKIVLFSSKLCGSLEMKTALRDAGAPDTPVLETDAIFASRLQDDESVWIKGIKRWTLYSATNCTNTLRLSKAVTEFFPGLEPAQNLIQRGLTDFGALAHAPIMLANMNTIDSGSPFRFYWEGMTERTVVIMEKLEEEFRLVARAYGSDLIPMKELLNRYYGCRTDSLLAAMRSVPNYEHSLSPQALDHRFLTEDVACTLVPASELGHKAGLSLPVINSVITLASVLSNTDLRSNGRTLDKLGLGGLSYRAISLLINS